MLFHAHTATIPWAYTLEALSKTSAPFAADVTIVDVKTHQDDSVWVLATVRCRTLASQCVNLGAVRSNGWTIGLEVRSPLKKSQSQIFTTPSPSLAVLASKLEFLRDF